MRKDDKAREDAEDKRRETDRLCVERETKKRGNAIADEWRPSVAIRLYCISCTCWQTAEVRDCPATDCFLWKYRMGKRPEAVAKSRQKSAEATAARLALKEVESTDPNKDTKIGAEVAVVAPRPRQQAKRGIATQ